MNPHVNWTPITEDSVRAAKFSGILTKARSMASSQGDSDPLPEAIADVVSQIRASISVGNTIDIDVASIPNSLKALALRMIVRRIKDYVEYPLREDERKQASDDLSYLNRIIDSKIRFELPDNPAGSSNIQTAGELDVVSSERTNTRHSMNGLF